MNKVILTGRFTRDPDVRYSQGDNPMAVAKFSLAVPRKFKRENEPDCDFINCTAFGKIAEAFEKYCYKGTKLCISGHIQTGSYTNKDGVKVYTTEVLVDDWEFAESKKNNSGSNGGGYNNQQLPNDGFMNIPDGIDEELPFN